MAEVSSYFWSIVHRVLYWSNTGGRLERVALGMLRGCVVKKQQAIGIKKVYSRSN
jgi:hypothetical protein